MMPLENKNMNARAGIVALGTSGPNQVVNNNLSGKNWLINGGFGVAKWGVSQSGTGYGVFDRWRNDHSGSSKTTTLQSFTVGQTDVPGGPVYYSRTVVTTSAGASNYVKTSQRIFYVGPLANETVTLSFSAKADAAKNIAIELVQNFGTGGSPSSEVTAIGAQTVALTTSWARYSATISVPSISGKTVGSNFDDYLEVNFWFDAGTDFDARTGTLGQQSGTFELSNCQLEIGSRMTDFERKLAGEEERECDKYYKFAGIGLTGVWESATDVFLAQNFERPMRGTPTITLLDTTPEVGFAGGTSTGTASTIVSSGGNADGFYARVDGFSGATAGHGAYCINSSAVFGLDAEL